MGLLCTGVEEIIEQVFLKIRLEAEGAEGKSGVSGRKGLLIMLDYDGTVVPFAPLPQMAQPGTEELEVLQQLADKEGVVLAIVSGRSLYDLEALLPLQGVFLAGWHGAALREPGGNARWLIDTAACRAVMQVREKLKEMETAQEGWPAGFWVEDKELSLALHFRQADPAQAEEALGRVLAEVSPLIKENGLETLAGAKVLEIRPRGVNKGRAVEALLGLYPDFYPLYLGDDITDEDAFFVLRGRGLGIYVGEEERPTAASCRLRNCEEVINFLKELSARW